MHPDVKALLPGTRAWTDDDYEAQENRRRSGAEIFARMCKQEGNTDEDQED